MSNTEVRNSSLNTVPVQFPMREGIAGGLPNVLAQEARLSTGNVSFLTTDSKSGSFENATIRAADPLADPMGAAFKFLFDTGAWTYLHPDAHTTVAAPADAVAAMYPEDVVAELRQSIAAEMNDASDIPEFGSLEFMHKYVERFGPDQGVHRLLTDRFDRQLKEIPQGSSVNWQDYFFVPAINRHAHLLKARGVFQSMTLHTSVPDSLHMSAWGRQLLSAASRVDVVQTHTDKYGARLQQQCEQLGLKVPEVRRYDLGLDRSYVTKSLAAVNKLNYKGSIPGYSSMDSERRQFIDAVFQSQDKIPHRFICADRVDPIKGLAAVVDGIEFLLDNEVSAGGKSLNDLRDTYRFFLLCDHLHDERPDKTAISPQYADYVEQRIKVVCEKYPGIVVASSALSGDAKIAIPAIMRGCHLVTGGAQEGFNITTMEAAEANAATDTLPNLAKAVISGDNNGFALQATEQGFDNAAFFSESHDGVGFAKQFREVVRHEQAGGEQLAKRHSRLIDFVRARKGSTLLSE